VCRRAHLLYIFSESHTVFILDLRPLSRGPRVGVLARVNETVFGFIEVIVPWVGVVCSAPWVLEVPVTGCLRRGRRGPGLGGPLEQRLSFNEVERVFYWP